MCNQWSSRRMIISVVNQIVKPTSAIPANTQSKVILLRTAVNAIKLSSPIPVRITPGMKKFGKVPCIIATDIFIR